jgi:NitT/TauT family transport system permease protein
MAYPFKNVLLPNRPIDQTMVLLLTAFWLGLALLIWVFSPFQSLPGPGETWAALGRLWWEEGMGRELGATLGLIFRALFITVVSAMLLSYLTVIAAFRPLVEGIAKLRFLGLTGLIPLFTLLSGGGYNFKVTLLTFGMMTYFVTAMAQVVIELPKESFEHMRVMGASEPRIIWEVVILGTFDKALEVLRQNVAIGWTMITMVEGYERAGGGLGALILSENKHFKLPEVYAILLVVLVVGLILDYAMGLLSRMLCPYVLLERVKR